MKNIGIRLLGQFNNYSVFLKVSTNADPQIKKTTQVKLSKFHFRELLFRQKLSN